MAVAESVTLPAQPTSGRTTFIPLGGDGYTSPHAAYEIRTMNVTGDASGGSARLSVVMDDRFCSLVTYVTGQVGQATPADADFRWTFGGITDQGVLTATALTVASSVTVGKTWRPTPIIQPGGALRPEIGMLYTNVDGDEYYLDAMVYLFNIRAREIGPLGYLLWAAGSS